MALTYRADQPQAPGTRREWRRWLNLTLGGLACLLLAGLIAIEPRWPRGDGGIRLLPREMGYKAAVDELIRVGLLGVRQVRRASGPPINQIVLRPEVLDRNPNLLGDCRTYLERVSFSPRFQNEPSRDCRERLEQFMRDSTYLAQDMRQPAQWDFDGNAVTAIKSNAHILVPAGDPRKNWRGRVKYREEEVANAAGTVNAARAALMLSQVGTNRSLFRFVDNMPPVRVGLDTVLAGEQGAGEGGMLGITLGAQGSAGALLGPERISFRRLGRAVLVGVPPRLRSTKLYVDGRAWQPPSAEFDNTSYLLLRPDQYLTLEDSRGRRLTAQLVETPGSISEVSGGRRIREPSLFDVAQRLEMSRTSADIMSSIVGSLHLDLQKQLAASMETGLAAGAAPDFSYRGTALLMDGLTGEIAAAATYPTEREQLAPDDREDPRRTAWLRINFNFQPLPVGSSAKIPFAAAITQRYPDLLAMRIPFHGSFDTIDGHPILLPDGSRKTLSNHGSFPAGTLVDFNSFIAHSNNEYAITLLRRATAREVGTRWRSVSSWAANLWRVACVIPFGLVPREPDLGWLTVSDQCSPYLWREDNGDAIGTNPIPSEWLKLQMGAISNEYYDLYMDIIGGGRSTWTTANLAQAYARLFSGRAVSPNLNRVETPAARNGVSIALPVWTAIGRGMISVLGIGTASALQRNLLGREGAVPAGVYFYAKTGTSTLPPPAVGDGHVLVLMAARTRNGQPPRRPADICALKLMVINLQRDASSALALAETLLRADPQQRYMRWMTRPCPANRAF